MGKVFSLNHLFNLAKAALTQFWKGHFQSDMEVSEFNGKFIFFKPFV